MTSRNCAGYSHLVTRCLIIFVMTFFFSVMAGTAFSANLTLAWDANSEPDLTGYRVYCGESGGSYNENLTKEVSSDTTTCEFTGLEEGATYYFAAKAVSQTGESDYSQEISYTVPAAPAAPQDIDNDGDGFTENYDCNDADSSIHPGATDECGDGIDQDCSGADVACPDDNSLAREAQAGELIGGFETRSDPAAISGTYVYAPNGVGTRMDGPDDTHKIIYTFNILEEGTYRIKGTVYAANGSDDSFWVKVNDDPADGYLWDVLQNTGYQQDYVNDRNGADPVEVSLKAGPNTVTIYLREDGTRLDNIELELVQAASTEMDSDGDGFTVAEGDCDDADYSIYPGASEVCSDGIDQNCDGNDIDCKDIDDDGDGHTENMGDCNDSNVAVHPGAEDICGDGIDQDCDGSDLACVDYTTDSDNDGLTNYEEENVYLTNPFEADSDGDGVPDGEEVAGGSDPNYADPKPDASTSEIPLEFGEVEVDYNWKTVTLNRIFDDPVVIAGAMSYEGPDPAVIRVRNVNRNSFEVRIQEWDYLNQNHTAERVGYIVIESGEHKLANGSHLKAGRFNADAVSSFEAAKFDGQPFNSVPVVLSTLNSVNENDAVVVRLKNITTTGFYYRIQEQESNAKNHTTETAGYIAWEPSVGSMEGFRFEVGRTSDSVTQQFQSVPFDVSLAAPPVFLAAMQTTDGGDTAAVRWQNKQAGGIEVKVEEEQSKDTETRHTTEVVGYMVFEADNSTSDNTQQTGELVLEAEDDDLTADGDSEIGSDSVGASDSFSLWDDTAVPMILSDSDTSAVELGVKFQSDVDGYITGLRFYKSTANTGMHVGNLWTADGTLLSSVTFVNETASGWQEMALPTPVPITAGKNYVASYHTTVGRYSTDVSYFAGVGLDNPPLRALADGENGGNGVYLYGAGGFPNQTWNASNYWVDVVFQENVGSP